MVAIKHKGTTKAKSTKSGKSSGAWGGKTDGVIMHNYKKGTVMKSGKSGKSSHAKTTHSKSAHHKAGTVVEVGGFTTKVASSKTATGRSRYHWKVGKRDVEAANPNAAILAFMGSKFAPKLDDEGVATVKIYGTVAKEAKEATVAKLARGFSITIH